MPIQTTKMTNYRWVICLLLFLATMINYMDRQALSLTWHDFIAPVFGWKDDDYAEITAYFSVAYAIFMFVAGRIIDNIGVKKGYMWSMGIWTTGAILHAFCGIVASGLLANVWLVDFDGAIEELHSIGMAALPVTSLSIYFFMACRFIMGFGQAGNFPAAIKVTAEYFPKKDTAFATAIFNSGASVGALIAPITIPLLARNFGWEKAFIAVGAIGYLWMFLWLRMYYRPFNNKNVNPAELNYIHQDDDAEEMENWQEDGPKVGIFKCLVLRQTWAFIIGKFMTDCAWWFFLFWTPVYISDIYGYSMDSNMGIALIFVLYSITMLSIVGGYLPTYFINKMGMTPYESRMRVLFIFACIQLLGIFVQPMANISPWLLAVAVGIIGASHQAWSANIFSLVADLFPKSAIATVIGIGGMAGGIGSYLLLHLSGVLLRVAETYGEEFSFLGFTNKQAAYMILFSLCSVVYLIGWGMMKLLVPDYMPVHHSRINRELKKG